MPAADPLALAVTRLPGWRWRAGMRWLYRDGSGRAGPYRIPKGAVPDLDDEATGGALLGMLHATGRLRSLDVRPPGLPDEVEMAPWCVWLDLDDPEGGWILFDAPTLARACAAALVAIGRCA